MTDTHAPFTRTWNFPDPLPEHLDHPAVETMCSRCPTFKEHVTQCSEIRCAFDQQRRGHEQRRKDDARLAEEKEGGSRG